MKISLNWIDVTSFLVIDACSMMNANINTLLPTPVESDGHDVGAVISSRKASTRKNTACAIGTVLQGRMHWRDM